MAKIKVLRDYIYEGYEDLGEALEPGTVIENAQIIADPFGEYKDVDAASALYAHPTTGEPWISYHGAFEILER